jgi:AcrR family transcriptional regulator
MPRAARRPIRSAGPSRPTARERLLHTAAELVSQGTYATTTVAQISSRAGVSTATFYKLFADKEQCFLHGYRHVAGELVGGLKRRAEETDPSLVWRATLDGLFELAAEQPQTILLLAAEAKLSTRHGVQARDRLLAEIESIVERGRAPGEAAVLDIPAKAIVGATVRLLVRRLREENSDLEELRGALLRWIESYERSGQARWQTLTPTAGLQAGPASYSAGLTPPARPSRGRTRLSAVQVAEHQRQRILHATAAVTTENGYAETTVADIVAGAGLAREVFYRHFRDKQDAFMDAYQTGFQALMALTVGAYYTSVEWPERIWAALRAYTDFMANFPSFAHLGMVESHTVSPELVAQVDERVMAFTFFLQEGHAHLTRHPGAERSVADEAIAMAMYELVSHMIRHGRNDELPGLLPLMTYILLAPYIGAEAACEFVDGKVRESLAAGAA